MGSAVQASIVDRSGAEAEQERTYENPMGFSGRPLLGPRALGRWPQTPPRGGASFTHKLVTSGTAHGSSLFCVTSMQQPVPEVTDF